MRNFLANLRYKFSSFMQGRYGVDDFYRFQTALFYIVFVLNLFLKSSITYGIMLAILAYSTFRIFSRNYQARYRENQAYLKIKNKVVSFFKLQKRKITEKDYVFRNCPHCRQTLRLPRKKGKHTVSCPKCHRDFDVRI